MKSLQSSPRTLAVSALLVFGLPRRAVRHDVISRYHWARACSFVTHQRRSAWVASQLGRQTGHHSPSLCNGLQKQRGALAAGAQFAEPA